MRPHVARQRRQGRAGRAHTESRGDPCAGVMPWSWHSRTWSPMMLPAWTSCSCPGSTLPARTGVARDGGSSGLVMAEESRQASAILAWETVLEASRSKMTGTGVQPDPTT
jgi:hypothetical protein